MNVERLVLSGVIVTTFLSSMIVMLTTLLDAAKLRSFTFWLLGDLSQATRNGVYLSFAAVVVGTIILTSQARALNLMMVGERDAFDFGVEVGRVRMLVFGAASLVVGAAVAASGSVGYVGLIVPHLVRLSVGSDNRCRAVLGGRGCDICRICGHGREDGDRSEGVAGRSGDGVDRRTDVYLFVEKVSHESEHEWHEMIFSICR